MYEYNHYKEYQSIAKTLREMNEAKMEDAEVLKAAKALAENGKDEKTKSFGKGLVSFYEKNKSFTPDQVSGLQNIMKNASFQMAKEDVELYEMDKKEIRKKLSGMTDAQKRALKRKLSAMEEKE